MSTILVLHHKKDFQIAKDIGSELSKSGYKVNYTDDIFGTGSSWQDYLKKYVSDCDIVLALVTNNSVGSESICVATEMASGYMLERGGSGFIPVMIGTDKLPIPLRHIRALGGKDTSSSQELFKDIVSSVNVNMGKHAAKEEKIQKVRKEFEDNAAKFIASAKVDLDKKVRLNWWMSIFSYALALVFLLLGFAIIIFSREEFISLIKYKEVVLYSLVGVVSIGFVTAISRFLFILGKSFMAESLRHSDRSHAISFGEFYLKAFSDDRKWSEMKEVFQHWNIDSGSTFISQESNDANPQALSIILKAITDLKK